MSFVEEKQLEDQYVIHSYGRKPVEFVSGNGMHLQDDAGNDYLDFLSGIGVCCLGHSPKVLTDAITAQAEKLMHVSNYYYIEGRGTLANTLSNLLNKYVPEAEQQNWKTFFANSGAEANECAIKLARYYSKMKGNGGQTIVCMNRSFHGRTLATLAATQQPVKQSAFQPLPGGFVGIQPNDIAELEKTFAERNDIAAIIVETVQGECGVYPLDPEYLARAAELAHANGALLITDEVQCGIYRCGEPYAFQVLGTTPDIVTMAKGIAGGFPMGACAAKAEVADVFEPGLHGSTFGGGNLAIASANATLKAIEDQNLAENVKTVGAYLKEQLATLPHVVEIRGLGLMVACEFDETVDAAQAVLDGLKAGLVLNYTGAHTMRFLPPLICSKEDVDVMIAKLKDILAA